MSFKNGPRHRPDTGRKLSQIKTHVVEFAECLGSICRLRHSFSDKKRTVIDFVSLRQWPFNLRPLFSICELSVSLQGRKMEKQAKCRWCSHERCSRCQKDKWPALRDGCCQCRAKTIRNLNGGKKYACVTP